jgi:hypothetical protein
MNTAQSALGLFGVDTQSNVTTTPGNTQTISKGVSTKWLVIGGVLAIGLVFVLNKKIK